MMRPVKVIYLVMLFTTAISRGMFPTSISVQYDKIVSTGHDFIKVSMKVDDSQHGHSS